MRLHKMTLLAGLTFALAACASRQTEEETGDIEPSVADTAIGDTALTPTEPVPAPGDTGILADTGFVTDTGMVADTLGTPPVPPEDTTTFGDTTTYGDPTTTDTLTTETDTTLEPTMEDTSMTSDTTGGMSDTAMTQMGDTATVEETEGGEVVSSGELATTGNVVWQATLLPPGEAERTPGEQVGGINVGGAAYVKAGSDANSTSARLQLSGSEPGATHPWHIHKGTCSDDQGILGPADAYTPITAGEDGQAEVSVILPFKTPTSGEYIINVHKSASEMGTIIACGPLTLSGGQ